jgi:hypothetical protein
METPSLLFLDQKTLKKGETAIFFKKINKLNPYKTITKREVSAGSSKAGVV